MGDLGEIINHDVGVVWVMDKVVLVVSLCRIEILEADDLRR